MTKLWGLDLSELRWNKLRSENMWYNRDYHHRRTRFICYHAATIFCVISECLGTKALADYASIQPSIAASTQPPFQTDTTLFIAAAAFNIFAGVYVAAVFGTAFFFDLFWPDRKESRAVKRAWAICSVLACCVTLTSVAFLTHVVSNKSVRVTDEMGVDRVLTDYHGPPLRYSENAFAVAVTAFMWVGCLCTFLSTVYLIENHFHIRKFGAKSTLGRLADVDGEGDEEGLEAEATRKPTLGLAAPSSVPYQYGQPFSWPGEKWIPESQIGDTKSGRSLRLQPVVGSTIQELEDSKPKDGVHGFLPQEQRESVAHPMKLPGPQDGAPIMVISRGDLKKKLNEVFEKMFAEPNAGLTGFSQAERQELRMKWYDRWGGTARLLEKEVVTPKELESVDWYISVVQFALWIVQMMRHEERLKRTLEERKLGWNELAKVESEKRGLVVYGKGILDKGKAELGDARYRPAYGMALWVLEQIQEIESRRETGAKQVTAFELPASECTPARPQAADKMDVALPEEWGGGSEFSDLFEEIDRIGEEWRAESVTSGWEADTPSIPSDRTVTQGDWVPEEEEEHELYRPSSTVSFDRADQEVLHVKRRRWEHDGVLDPISSSEAGKAAYGLPSIYSFKRSNQEEFNGPYRSSSTSSFKRSNQQQFPGMYRPSSAFSFQRSNQEEFNGPYRPSSAFSFQRSDQGVPNCQQRHWEGEIMDPVLVREPEHESHCSSSTLSFETAYQNVPTGRQRRWEDEILDPISAGEAEQELYRSSSTFSLEGRNQDLSKFQQRHWEEKVPHPISRAKPLRAPVRPGRMHSFRQKSGRTTEFRAGPGEGYDPAGWKETGDRFVPGLDVDRTACTIPDPYARWTTSRVVGLEKDTPTPPTPPVTPRPPVLEEVRPAGFKPGELYDAVLGKLR